jgi:hypothetical protein
MPLDWVAFIETSAGADGMAALYDVHENLPALEASPALP